MSSQAQAPAPSRSYRGWLVFGGIILALLVFVVGSIFSIRGELASNRQAVLAQFGQVQNVMQRRNDVLINFANTAAAGAANERGALTDIAEARSKATAAFDISKSVSPADLANNKELQEKFFQAMAAQQQAMLKLTSVVEAYPSLRSTDLFLKLQDEVSGSENRVSIERGRSQKAILTYNNVLVKTMPGVIVGAVFGYKEMEYYTASIAAQQAPDLRLNLQPEKK